MTYFLADPPPKYNRWRETFNMKRLIATMRELWALWFTPYPFETTCREDWPESCSYNTMSVWPAGRENQEWAAKLLGIDPPTESPR